MPFCDQDESGYAPKQGLPVPELPSTVQLGLTGYKQPVVEPTE